MSYVVIYLVNCLKLEKSCFKIHFQFCSFQKRLKKQYFGAKYKLFCKRCLLHSQSFLSWFQTCWDTRYISIQIKRYDSMPNFLELKEENLEMWRSQLEHQLESAIGFWHTWPHGVCVINPIQPAQQECTKLLENQ